MIINIICVGKIKEKYLEEAIREYSKRLSRYTKLTITEVSDEKTPQNASLKEETHIKEVEGQRILSHVSDEDYLIGLVIDGTQCSSTVFSDRICSLENRSVKRLDFIIGGSLGLSDQVIERCDSCLSFSEMTFPHQLMRVILLEQIYRAYKIKANEPYHK